jgi:prefoldin subunit 5
MGKPYVKPHSGQWISQRENWTVKNVVASVQPTTTDTAALDAQIALLQAQVASLNSQITSLNGQIAALQAQVAADAQTIATLQGQVNALTAQVASLNAQITSLQQQLAAYKSFGKFFYGNLTLVGGGIYVPPAYDNPVITVSNLIIPPRRIGQYTTIGGGYP